MTKKNLPLTDTEDKIYVYIRNTVLATGYSPTRAEIAKHLGFGAHGPERVQSYLTNMEKKGYIKLTRRSWRNIKINQGKQYGRRQKTGASK